MYHPDSLQKKRDLFQLQKFILHYMDESLKKMKINSKLNLCIALWPVETV